MSEWLTAIILSVEASSLVLASVMVIFSFLFGGLTALRLWGVGLLAISLCDVATLLVFDIRGIGPDFVRGFAAIACVGAGVSLSRGVRHFQGKPRRTIVDLGMLGVGIATGLVHLLTVGSDAVASPERILVGALVALSGANLLENGSPRYVRYAAYPLLIWGISLIGEEFVSVFFHPLEWLQSVSGGLKIAVGVGLLFVVARQETQRKEMARLAAEASDRQAAKKVIHFRRVLDGLPDAVITVDPDGLIVDFSAGAAQMLGYNVKEAKRLDASVIIPHPDFTKEPSLRDGVVPPGGAILAIAQGNLSEEYGQNGNLVARSRDGHHIPIELSVRTVDVDGEVLYVCSFRDITKKIKNKMMEEFLHRLDSAVLDAFRIEDVAFGICREMAEQFGASLTFLVMRDEVKGLSLPGLHGDVLRDSLIAFLARSGKSLKDSENKDVESQDILGEVLRTGQAHWSDGGEYPLDVPLFSSFGWLACLPIRQKGCVNGLFVLAGHGKRPGEEERSYMEDITRRIGTAIQMIGDQMRLRLQGMAMSAAASAIFVTDREGTIEWVNDAFSRLSGYKPSEIIGKTPSILRSGKQDGPFYEKFWKTIQEGKTWRGELVERSKTGRLYTVDQTVAPIFDDAGTISHFVAVHEDISERKQAEERILYLSNYDTLTRLPNRNLFRDQLFQALVLARNAREPLAVIFIDLAHFSRINDTLGHEIGDQLLMTVGSRINAVAAPYAFTVARIGGDEFAVIQMQLNSTEAAAHLAHRIIDSVSHPFDFDGLEVSVGTNVGIAIYPQDGESPEILMRNADMAMYRAVRSENDRCLFFSNDMNAEARARLGIEGDLRRAIENGDMTLHYQPQISMRDRSVVGVEALLRWRHASEGMIPPSRFIPIAEDTGLIHPLGEWVIQESLRQMREWRSSGLWLPSIAVNLSALQFRERELVEKIKRSLLAQKVDPNCLELELTESLLMEDAREAVRVLARLSNLGVTLAIDDFGTGYSSLSYLKQFPVDKLKLDQSFVKYLADDHNDAVIARATINLGHSLGLIVIAEGVETDAQYTYLRNEGCDEAQGYLFGKPVPASEIPVNVKRLEMAVRPTAPAR